MSWGVVETEAEVTEWLLSLPAKTFGHVRFYIDLLADQGVALGEPFTRHFGKAASGDAMFLLGSISKPINVTAVMTLFATTALTSSGC